MTQEPVSFEDEEFYGQESDDDLLLDISSCGGNSGLRDRNNDADDDDEILQLDESHLIPKKRDLTRSKQPRISTNRLGSSADNACSQFDFDVDREHLLTDHDDDDDPMLPLNETTVSSASGFESCGNSLG